MINQGEITMLTKKLELKHQSDLCGFSDAYIVVKGTITVVRQNNAKRNKATAFKNNSPFTKCILKINGVKLII